MLHDKRPPAIYLVIGVALVTGFAYSCVRIWAALAGSPFAHEIALSVALGAASVSTMLFGVAWCGLTVTVIESTPKPPTPPATIQPPRQVLDGYQPLEQSTQATYRPKLAFLPTGTNQAITLEISAEQLAELRRRVATNKLGLPVNGLQKFSSSEARKLRQEAEDKQLARVVAGNQLEWTPEAAKMILLASPAPFVRA